MVQTRHSETENESRTTRYRNWQQYDDDETSNPFTDLIQKDPVVCDNCFLKRYTRVTKEWWRGSFGWMDYERWVPYPEKSEEIPAEDPSGGTRLTCGNCGHRRSKHRPIPKHRIMEYAKNISETLDAKQIHHDREVLLATVQQQNNSENQGKQDSDVFAPAVAEAIRAVQETR